MKNPLEQNAKNRILMFQRAFYIILYDYKGR